MPMLERTAASLEPCHFQRVLPPSKTPFKSSRRLHTAFWQHGAADIELSGVWQALIREPLEFLNLSATSQNSSTSRNESLNASTFLLDFLYPQGAASLLRKLSPSVLDRYERPHWYLRGTGPRLFTSSASSPRQPRPSAEVPDDVACQTGSSATTFDGDIRPGSQDQLDVSKQQSLRDLLSLADNGDKFVRIWDQFHTLDDGSEEIRPQFIDYVTKHRNMTYLLAKSLQGGHWKTLWDVWARNPEAHREDAKAIDWRAFERHTKFQKMMEQLTLLIKEISQSQNVSGPATKPTLNSSLLTNFVYPIIHRYYQRFRPEHYELLPTLLEDPLLYELFLAHTTTQSSSAWRKLSDKLYKSYRNSATKIRGHVMRAMVHLVYKPVGNGQGMEMVLRDLYRRFPRLDMGLYRAYIIFYAQREDVKTAQRLFDEFRSHYPEERKAQQNPLPQYPDFFDLLQQYALRGELGEARRIFTQAQSDFGPKLNTHCWNVLLNAHAKAREYDAAVRVFVVLKKAVSADHYSYGTMMGMTGSRGDLEFTLELYRMAKSEDIQPNVTMVDCVVEAYCQNDKFNDAENIVKITTERERFEKSELTILWNTLLWHHAVRRDLKRVNAILNEMTEFQIPYDDETYSHLLRALAWCKQPHHALFLLQQAHKTHAFRPTLEHYTLLMSAFFITKQPQDLLRTSNILRDLGMPQTGHVLLRVLQALSALATKHRLSEPDHARDYLLSALRRFREYIDQLDNATINLPQRTAKGHRSWIQNKSKPATVALRTEHANILIHTFTLMRQTTDIGGIIELWQSSAPETLNMKEPPLRLLHSLMLAAFYDGDYEEVRQLWRIIFERAVKMASVSAPGTTRAQPLPAMRYMLTDPLKTMQRMHGVTQDPTGLRETVTSVLRAGFRLDSKNWNFYVQLLANLKRWREAFIVCEEQLMPFWHGWARVRARTPGVPRSIPLDVRRRFMNPHNPRPISYTLMVLSKAYMDLEQMAAWSGEAERLLAYITHKCPVSVSAVKSAVRTNSSLEKKILTGGKPQDATDKSDEQILQKRKPRQKLGSKKQKYNVQRRNQQEVEMPLSVKEMMEQVTSESPGVQPPQDWEVEDNVQYEREFPDVPAATVDAFATGPEQDEGWYDINEPDEQDEDWPTMYSEQTFAELDELQAAEAAIFSKSPGSGSSRLEASAEAGGSEAEEPTFSAAQNAFLETYTREPERIRSRRTSSTRNGRSEGALQDSDRNLVQNSGGYDKVEGKNTK
ncbi:hypothetical protein N0V82_006726 [Gnomoniopsis sp. IMI 355080]|nr:hypothetical protein N0V82_006726 [Gnomoniopsis sp. IMI 355080]